MDLGSCNQGTPLITGSRIYQMCHLGLPLYVHCITYICNIFCILCISVKFESRFMTIPYLNLRHSSIRSIQTEKLLPTGSFTCISMVSVKWIKLSYFICCPPSLFLCFIHTIHIFAQSLKKLYNYYMYIIV